MPVQGSNRNIGIAVDLSDESAHAVRWVVSNYARPGDSVVLIHVQPTKDLHGADWGKTRKSQDCPRNISEECGDIVSPLRASGIPYTIYIVKDHDMKERVCLEAERLKLDILILGAKGNSQGEGSPNIVLSDVSDYCASHCGCPVITVQYQSDDSSAGHANAPFVESKM